MLSSLRHEFVEQGHLYGKTALVARIDPEDVAFSATSLLRSALESPSIPLHVVAEWKAQAALDSVLAVARKAHRAGVRVSCSLRPGIHVSDDFIAVESTLRVQVGDLARLWRGLYDPRVGSISVHCWPGASTLERLTLTADYPLGRFLVLAGDDYGQAKVWLTANRGAGWSLRYDHPLNDLEPAELTEMTQS